MANITEDGEQALSADPRLADAIALFNAQQWYPCHDGFEALWHETAGPMRPVLQGILQIAVSQIHRERGNLRGATVLMGEGLGRLNGCDEVALGLDLALLRAAATAHLAALQSGEDGADAALPALRLVPQSPL